MAPKVCGFSATAKTGRRSEHSAFHDHDPGNINENINCIHFRNSTYCRTNIIAVTLRDLFCNETIKKTQLFLLLFGVFAK